jgi:hypothetical protein
MALKKTHDAVYAEKYTDRDGNEKTRYTNLGSLLQRDDGSLTMKMESIPVGFSGWINFYEPKPKDGERPQQGNTSSARRPPRVEKAVEPDGFEEDSIPFISNRHTF